MRATDTKKQFKKKIVVKPVQLQYGAKYKFINPVNYRGYEGKVIEIKNISKTPIYPREYLGNPIGWYIENMYLQPRETTIAYIITGNKDVK